MLEGEGAVEEPSMMKELASEDKNARDSKKVVEKPSEEAGNGQFGDVTCRKFMSLAVLDTTSIIRFLSEGTKSAKH
jgi:hypothetical protein